MPWNIVGRTEQRERIRIAVSDPFFGPLMITGEPGSGRSTMLAEVVRELGPGHAAVRLSPRDTLPFATLRTVLRNAPDTGATIGEVADALALALTEPAGGAVVAIDDAHLADQASLLVLRALSRRGQVSLLFTRPTTPRRAPDPTDCLSYEPGTQAVKLPPLTTQDVSDVLAGLLGEAAHPTTSAALHAASGGNPAALHDLLISGGLLDHVVRQGAAPRLREPEPGQAGPLAAASAGRVVEAVRDAWRELELDQVDELCRLAGWYGFSDQVAAIAATTALFRGRPEQCARILDTITPSPSARREHWVLARAMCVGLGDRRIVDAVDILDRGARELPVAPHRLVAYRSWLLAVTGRLDSAHIEPTASTDRETVLFTQAALACAATGANRPAEAVAHLRRGLIAAAGCRDTVPWMAPLLTGHLIDALLLAGRINEATGLASEFHAGKPRSGWDVAVAITALVNGTLAGTAQRAREVEGA